MEKLVIREKERHDKTMALLRSLPDHIEWRFVTDSYARISVETYEKLVYTLHALREELGQYKLESYYESGVGSLAIEYQFGEHRIIIDCSDTEGALERISDGKCKLVTTTSTRKEVVCETQ